MSNDRIFDKIAPIIQQKEIISIKINDKMIPLKKSMPFDFFSKEFLDAFSVIEEFIDFSKIFKDEKSIENWEKEELEQFYNIMSIEQQEIIKILVKEKEITRKNLVKELKIRLKDSDDFNNKTLAGIVAGLNRRINSSNREKLFYINSKYYRINKKYINYLSENLNHKIRY